MSLDPAERDAIEEIVEHTVRETLLKLGVDVSTPDKILEFQDNIRYVASWRATMQAIGSAGVVAVVGTIGAGLLAAIWIGLKAMAK